MLRYVTDSRRLMLRHGHVGIHNPLSVTVDKSKLRGIATGKAEITASTIADRPQYVR